MMNELITYFTIALTFASIGFYIGKILTKLTSEKEKATLEERASLMEQSKEILETNFDKLQKELKQVQEEKENLSILNARQDSELFNSNQKLNENKKEVEKLQDKFTKEF